MRSPEMTVQLEHTETLCSKILGKNWTGHTSSITRYLLEAVREKGPTFVAEKNRGFI